MPRVRAFKSFVWNLRDIDIGDEFDVSERDAYLLIHGYQYAVAVAEAAALPTAIVVEGEPAVQHREPKRRQR